MADIVSVTCMLTKSHSLEFNVKGKQQYKYMLCFTRTHTNYYVDKTKLYYTIFTPNNFFLVVINLFENKLCAI